MNTKNISVPGPVVIKNVVVAPVHQDKAVRKLAERAAVQEVTRALNAWAYEN